jgi:hypothetical protein
VKRAALALLVVALAATVPASGADFTAGSASHATFTAAADGVPPAGVDIQSGNGGRGPGRMGPGDWLTLTWTEQLAPASVLAGWDGTARAITVRVVDNGSDDRLEFFDGASALNLASELLLGGNFVTANKDFGATMVQSGASITVTLASGNAANLATASAGTMRWRPAAGATDAAGNASSTGQVTESGAPADVDF